MLQAAWNCNAVTIRCCSQHVPNSPSPVDAVMDSCASLLDVVESAQRRTRRMRSKRSREASSSSHSDVGEGEDGLLHNSVREQFVSLLRAAVRSKSTKGLVENGDGVRHIEIVFSSLAAASLLMQEERREFYKNSKLFPKSRMHGVSTANAGSPYMSEEDHDGLAVLLSNAASRMKEAMAAASASPSSSSSDSSATLDSWMETAFLLLKSAVQLEVGDSETLGYLSRVVASRVSVKRMDGHQIAEALHLITLCNKRKQSPLPNLDVLLAAVTSSAIASSLSAADLLKCLSASVRLRSQRPHSDVNAILSMHLAKKLRNDGIRLSLFSNADLVFGIRFVALSKGQCSPDLAGILLDVCCERAAKLSPSELGDVCKSLRAIHMARDVAYITRSACGKETRRLMPQLVQRAVELLGQFSLRDARCVLECLDAFEIRHSMVFGQLTPFVSRG